jgi:hypothetical protein
MMAYNREHAEVASEDERPSAVEESVEDGTEAEEPSQPSEQDQSEEEA